MSRPREGEEPERYELRESQPYSFELDRREFQFVLGTGLLLTLTARSATGASQDRGRRRVASPAERLHLGADGIITVLTGKVEVGQGSRTQIAMAAAEELRVPVENIRVVMADSARVPDDGGTSGSRTTPSTIPAVRSACAAVRELLIDHAASSWSTDRARLRLQDGRVTAAGRSMSYADLATKSEEELRAAGDKQVTATAVDSWTVLGNSVPKLGGVDIVTGRHRYPSDIVRPGMLHGVVLRPPSLNSSLESVDLSEIQQDGVTAVHDGDFVGFAARTSAEARSARDAARKKAAWKTSEHPSSDELYEVLRDTAREGGGRRRGGGGTRGSVEEGLAEAADGLEPTYQIAYVQHAPMEPRAAVAEWNKNALTVWTGTQNPSRVRSQLAEAFRIGTEAVRVLVPDTGGGFGGKHTGEVAIEAARLAKAAKRPVSVRWSRQEEFTWAYFRPAGVIDIRAGLDGDGKLIAWEQVNFNSGSSALATPYSVPNVSSQFRTCDAPLRQGSYRALASTANIFARESCMDELAELSGADPLEFRIGHLDNERMLGVLRAAAERFDWIARRKDAADSDDRGVGLACGTEKGSYAAACVEVKVDWTEGTYRVIDICQAFECGAVQNPVNLTAQVEGCVIQGLGAVLREEIEFRGGRIRNPRFSAYQVPRFEDVPPITTVLVDRPDLPSAGAGETPIVNVAPATANALYAATGVRIRSLPLRNEEFRAG